MRVENEQADTGRDGRTCLLARPISQARTGQGKIIFLLSADHDQDGNLTRLIHTLLNTLAAYPYMPSSAQSTQHLHGTAKILKVHTLSFLWSCERFDVTLISCFKSSSVCRGVPPGCLGRYVTLIAKRILALEHPYLARCLGQPRC